MSGTATIVVSIVGAAVGIIGVLGLMLRILATNVTRELQAGAQRISELKTDLSRRIDDTNQRIDELKTDLGRRIDDTNQRIENLATEMHQRFDRVHQELGENRERMAKLEGSLEGFLAGRRDRDAA